MLSQVFWGIQCLGTSIHLFNKDLFSAYCLPCTVQDPGKSWVKDRYSTSINWNEFRLQIRPKKGEGERKQKQCDDSEKGWETAFAQMVRKVFFFKDNNNLTIKRQKGEEETNHLNSEFHQKEEFTKKRNVQFRLWPHIPHASNNCKNPRKEKVSTTFSVLKETLRNHASPKMLN